MLIASLNVLNHKDSFLDRLPAIIEQFSLLEPDVICLQEVIDEYQPDVEPGMAGLGMTGVYAGVVPTRHGYQSFS